METINAAALRPEHTSPGIMLIGRMQRGVAVVVRLLRHEGVLCKPLPNGAIGVECVTPASAQWLAWYSAQIVANGWQPYDQPHGAAYIPVSFSQLVTRQISSEGLLLRQNSPDRATKLKTTDRAFKIACSEGQLAGEFARLLRESGLSSVGVEQAVQFLLGTNSAVTNAAQERIGSAYQVQRSETNKQFSRVRGFVYSLIVFAQVREGVRMIQSHFRALNVQVKLTETRYGFFEHLDCAPTFTHHGVASPLVAQNDSDHLSVIKYGEALRGFVEVSQGDVILPVGPKGVTQSVLTQAENALVIGDSSKPDGALSCRHRCIQSIEVSEHA